MTTVLGALTAVLLLGFAASAGAESPGLDQYVETIPGAGGNHVAEKGDNGGGGGESGGGDSTSGPTVDSSQLDALRSQGEAGRRAADVIEATSDGASPGGEVVDSKADPTKAGSSGVKPLDPADANGKPPVEAILSSMFGGGSGIVLPLIMLAVLVGGLIIAARTRAGSIDD